MALAPKPLDSEKSEYFAILPAVSTRPQTSESFSKPSQKALCSILSSPQFTRCLIRSQNGDVLASHLVHPCSVLLVGNRTVSLWTQEGESDVCVKLEFKSNSKRDKFVSKYSAAQEKMESTFASTKAVWSKGLPTRVRISDESTSGVEPAPSAPAPAKAIVGSFEKPKVAEGSWKCDVCMITNKPGVSVCASCETPKDGAAPPPAAAAPAVGGFSFAPTGASSTAATTGGFSSFAAGGSPVGFGSFSGGGGGGASSSSGGGFSFAPPTATSSSPATTTTTTTAGGGFSFAPPDASSPAPGGFTFGETGGGGLNFSGLGLTSGGSSANADPRKVLTDLYTAKDQSRLPKIEGLLEKYKGNYDEMYGALMKKYGVSAAELGVRPDEVKSRS